jgi:hypothetical protein
MGKNAPNPILQQYHQHEHVMHNERRPQKSGERVLKITPNQDMIHCSRPGPAANKKN